MEIGTSTKGMQPRNKVAYYTLIISSSAIIVLAIITMVQSNGENAMTIFNTTLPVFASWIGTVLAFYFGRENFESANKQVQEIVTTFKDEKSSTYYSRDIMITPYAMTTFMMKTEENNIMLDEFFQRFKTHHVSRLPIIDSNKRIKYIVHESKLHQYLSNQELDIRETSFDDFLLNKNYTKGYLLVSENTSVEDIKKILQESKNCKDIFVTKEGKEDEELLGWIPDIHLLKLIS
jgi:predicted transcriptional regulator